MKIIGVIYSPYYLHIGTIRGHVEGFASMQSFDVRYVPIESVSEEVLSTFDAIIVHYAIRFAFPETLPKNFLAQFSAYKGSKFVFIQDEYDNTEFVRKAFELTQPDIVFTCVPKNNIHVIYSPSRFLKTTFINVLTGFAPRSLSLNLSAAEDREIDIGYRGRVIGNRYGKLGYEKWSIGEKVLSQQKEFPNLRMDISSIESDRIYGDDWYQFLANCKSVLGSESGSNIFDFDGKLNLIANKNSNLPYEIFERKFLEGLEIDGLMNQISPRAFEAAATRTMMILFPGSYSGILTAWEHYLPLERDLSNFSDVIQILKTPNRVNEITERTFEDLIGSGKYGQQSYFQEIEARLNGVLQNSKFVPSTPNAFPKLLDKHVPNLIQIKGIENLAFPGRKFLVLVWRVLPRKFRFFTLQSVNSVLRIFRNH